MSTLNLSRVWQVVRLQAMLHGRSLLSYFGPTLALLLGAALLSGNFAAEGGEPSFFIKIYNLALIVAGFIWAASSLPENKTPDGRQSFLTLPASDAEKWLGTYLYSGPAFFVVYTLGYLILTLVTGLVLAVFQLGVPPAFNPFSAEMGEGIATYFLIVQPIGMLGAIVFDKSASAKTVGAALLVQAALAFIGLLVFRIVFHEYFSGFFTVDADSFNFEGDGININLEDYGWWAGAALGLYLLTVAYFRFQEKEV